MKRHDSLAPVKSFASILVGALVLGTLLAGCGPKAPPAPTAAPAPTDSAATPPAADAAADPAAAQVEAGLALTPEALEALLAPIALYPDPVLAQVLVAAATPQMVLDAGNWLIQNPGLKGRALDEAAQPLGFSPSMRALLQFPEVVDMMCMKLDWTTELGEAFTADQAGVLDAVQRLRKQSVDVGNLKTSDQMKVETETQEGKEVITVEPADPKVVYVPQYDPVAVYAPPPAVIPAPTTTTTTVVEEDKGFSTGAMVTTGLLAFGAGMLVNEVFDDDDDDYDNYYPNYGGGGMYYGGRPYYPPPPGAYRPPYGGAYRPATGYNRPPGYQNGFNNNTIIVNNQGNDYWNKYGNKPTPYGGNKARPNSPISTARPNRSELNGLNQQSQTRQAQAKTQPRPAANDKSAGWQGQNTYKGAKPSSAKVQGGYAGATPEGKAARDQMVAGRPPVQSVDRARTSGSVDRGYGQNQGSTKYQGNTQARQSDQNRQSSQSRQSSQNRQSNQSRQSSQNREANEARQRDQARQSSRSSADRSTSRSSSGGTAFSNRDGGGSNARADSQRGRQSMPQGARSKGGGGKSRGGGGGGGRR
jgi:hypothetical protein